MQHGDINLLTVPARDAMAYGRALLDILFTKSEQCSSIFYIKVDKKSERPLLDRKRAQLLYGKTMCYLMYA